MTIDIIDMTEKELSDFPTIQQKLIRTAQQKKNELKRKMDAEVEEYEKLVKSNGTYNSSILLQYRNLLNAEYVYQVNILREQLIFNLSVKEPTNGDETGGSGSDDTGYLVDYELSYIERYAEVKNYYMSIEDPTERLNLYIADTTAQKYLGTFYNTLFEYLASFT